MKRDSGSRKIAKDDVIKFVLAEIVREKGRIESQTELTELVNKRLSKSGESYSVSPQRLRLVAVETPGVSIKAFTRSGNAPEKCPVCGHSLKKRKMKNLKGKKVPYGFTCPKCGFEAKGTKIAPRKYVFEKSR